MLCFFAQHLFIIHSVKPVAGADGAYIFGSENFPLLNILYHKQRTGTFVLQFLGVGENILDASECLFQNADLGNHLLKFLGLHGEGTVRTTVSPAECQMLFHHFGT